MVIGVNISVYYEETSEGYEIVPIF